MSSWDGGGVDELVCDVDVEASLAVFERRFARDRRNRRIAQAAVVTVAIVVLAGAAVDTLDGDAIATGVDGSITFEVLDVDLAGDREPGELDVVARQAEWEALFSDAGPRVDFHRWVVFAITTVDNCDEELVGFESDGSAIRPVLGSPPLDPEAPSRVCLLGLRTRTDVVAVERSDLPRRFTLLPPGDVSAGEAGVMVDLVMDEPPAASAGQIEFEVLDVRRAPVRRIGDLRIVRDVTSLAEDWTALGLGQRHTVPEVDFGERTVLILTATTGGCPAELDALGLDDGVVTPRFRSSVVGPSDCDVELVAYTFVLTVAGVDLDEIDAVRIAADPVLGTPGSTTLLG